MKLELDFPGNVRLGLTKMGEQVELALGDALGELAFVRLTANEAEVIALMLTKMAEEVEG